MKEDRIAKAAGLLALLLLVAVLAAGCSSSQIRGALSVLGGGAPSEGMPIARATNGASSSFTMTTCIRENDRAQALGEILLQLNQQGVLATADGPGTQVRVNLNLCGYGNPPAAPAQTRRS